jgi:hypothetical protein
VRWKKVVIGAVLGGLLGFGGQIVIDCFYPMNTRLSLYQYAATGSRDRELGKHFKSQRVPQARDFVLRGVLLVWLQSKAETQAIHAAADPGDAHKRDSI